jgi:ZIP family zinc transporter
MGIFWTAVLVTAAAGIGGTGLGGAAACVSRHPSDQAVSLTLSFAAGVMVAVVCFDMLEEAVGTGQLALTVAGVLLGVLLSAGLNGALERQRPGNDLTLAGLVMAAAIALHNVPEGMVIGAAFAGGSAGRGWIMALVIGIHNVPEGMAVATPLAAGGASRWRAAGLAALTGAPTAFGAAVGYCLGTMGDTSLTMTLGAAAGAMLYVVFGELLPEAAELWRGKAPALAAVAGVLLGMVIAEMG